MRLARGAPLSRITGRVTVPVLPSLDDHDIVVRAI
jgi:hypothetical protein